MCNHSELAWALLDMAALISVQASNLNICSAFQIGFAVQIEVVFFFLQLYCSHLLSWRLRQAHPAKLQSQQRMQCKQSRDLTFKMMLMNLQLCHLTTFRIKCKTSYYFSSLKSKCSNFQTPCVTWKKILLKNS